MIKKAIYWAASIGLSGRRSVACKYRRTAELRLKTKEKIDVQEFKSGLGTDSDSLIIAASLQTAGSGVIDR